MKWIFISIGAFLLAVVIVVIAFRYIVQKNVRDKGGMENPNTISQIQSSGGEVNTEKSSDE